jgi:tetratricopeptide (TPR) repeat protein
LIQLKIFNSESDRLKLGTLGTFPDHLLEQSNNKVIHRHSVNERLTRPWIRHYFIMQTLRLTNGPDELITRDTNLIDVFRSTVPLSENSFIESSMSSWRTFLDNAFRDAETPWYTGIRKVLVPERFYAAIEQLELEIPLSNGQRFYFFTDQAGTQRRLPRIPIKLFFSLPGNEKEKLIEILRQTVNNNPHNLDVALLTYCFLKAWDRQHDFLDIVRTENRNDLEEWYFWVENVIHSLGALKREAGDYTTLFFIYDRALFTSAEYKELADWFLRESEFKSAYHFYYKAKEFETALELLQNISTKEFADLTNLRRIGRGEKAIDLTGDLSRFATLYQEETETLRGFARIRAAETYKQVAMLARQNFDRETIETKYAFGELSEDEYNRLIRQMQERKQ